MIIRINGKEERIEKTVNLSAFIGARNLRPEGIVVEHNARIVPREIWETVTLAENDTLEIISFVGGG
ncbi:MAG TPA: sulfur carrier protein ThiS [Candidatus Omnitrophota bacterium]|jgi:thiamine biosynthesis protein ThiS|nr:MAG: Sulfur carrier protein ThiS [Candidatus Omnitrophica bacterium ADurb.Bin314]HOE68596.1 sulfur carrier protein ThiS [Candidatus Omnitrophota bacterium]HPW65431.1 sulfur carrier protein ThiS [Candidatus Omnitrophota bacterium]HQB94399.1 sulfur carrier protein ThiS [Candidatus Omnitrophota bacterium]